MGDAELTLTDYLQILLRRSWLIVLSTIVCFALAFAWTARQTPLYRSSATVLINQANASDLFDPVGTGTAFSYAERLAATEARFFTSGIVAEAVANKLGYETSVEVSEDDSADILTVTATSTDPAQAQEIAQTYAETYLEVREQRFASERTSIANQLAERLAEIDLQIADANDEDRLRLQSLRSDVAESLDLLTLTAGLAERSGTLIIDNAQRPVAPFSPRQSRNLSAGIMVGLIGGVALALMFEALDRSVKDRETLESITPGSPNLAVIPSLGKTLQRADTLVAYSDPTGQTAEAFRTLRAALQYVSVDDNARVIQIASAHSAAGKTTVAANLAITLAQSGQRVVVIDADLRRPRLHQLFNVPQVPGLTSAIIGEASLASCFRRMPGEGPTPFVLPSGPIPPGPAELLGSAAGERAIGLIRERADYVIIDTPPVLPVADTVVLSRYVDASILVVDASKTKRADVVLAFERLRQAGAPVIGTVLNKVKRRSALGGYGYGYGYGGYQADGAAAKAGIVGWFTRTVRDDAPIERLKDTAIPRLKAADSRSQTTPDRTSAATTQAKKVVAGSEPVDGTKKVVAGSEPVDGASRPAKAATSKGKTKHKSKKVQKPRSGRKSEESSKSDGWAVNRSGHSTSEELAPSFGSDDPWSAEAAATDAGDRAEQAVATWADDIRMEPDGSPS